MKSTADDLDPARPPGLLRRTVARWWAPILIGGALVTAGLMTAASIRLVGPYRAMSILRVDPATGAPDATKLDGGSMEPFLQTQVGLIASPNVLSTAANHRDVAGLPRIRDAADPVQELGRMVAVVAIPQTWLIRVSADSSTSAGEAATVVNAVVESYLATTKTWADDSTRAQVKNLDTYRVDLQNQTDELEHRWKNLILRGERDQAAERSDLIGPGHAARIEEKLIESEMARIEAQARIDALRSRPNRDSAAIEELETRVAVAKLFEQALNARRASAGDVAKARASDKVEIELLVDDRNTLKGMLGQVTRRLEQIKFETGREFRVRVVNTAIPSQRRTNLRSRPWILAGIPFAAFGAVLGLFAGVEALSGPGARPKPSAPEAID